MLSPRGKRQSKSGRKSKPRSLKQEARLYTQLTWAEAQRVLT